MEYTSTELFSILVSVWKRVPTWLSTYIENFHREIYVRGFNEGQRAIDSIDLSLIVRLLQTGGNKIEAIKAIRESKNWDLGKAKDWVDNNMDFNMGRSLFQNWADVQALFQK